MPGQWEDTMDMQIVLSVLLHMQQFRTRDHWTRQQLEVHQAVVLRSLREYAYAHSPFYQLFHQGLTDAPLSELPVLTKAMLMEHFDELVTDRAIRLEAVKAHLANLSGDERFLGRYRVIATPASSSSTAPSGRRCWPRLPAHASGAVSSST
jgi:phenylacetate-CoA ligase